MNKTKICALAFWIDFCISIVPRPLIIRTVHRSKTFDPTYSIFGPSISFPPNITPAQVRAHVKNLLVSIFQVIDLIAETLQRRRLTREYNKHLTPASTTMKLPKSHERYPDFAGND